MNFLSHPNSFLSIKGILDGPMVNLAPVTMALEIPAGPGKLLDVADAAAKDPGWAQWMPLKLRRITDTFGSCVYLLTLTERPFSKALPFKHSGYVQDDGSYPKPGLTHLIHLDHPELRLGYGKPMMFPKVAAVVIQELLEVLET